MTALDGKAARVAAAIDRWLIRTIVSSRDDSAVADNSQFRALLRTLPALLFYGAIMGSWGLWDAGRLTADGWMQILFSSIKLPLLIGATFLLGLPTFVVLYALAGLAGDFRRVLTLLIDTQGIFAVALLSLSPFTLLWYGSTTSYGNAVVFNGILFAVAALVRQIILRRRFNELIRRSRRHKVLLRLWFILYAFVGVQMGWLLRPFIGVPGGEARLLREDGWGNAYVEVVRLIAGVLGR